MSDATCPSDAYFGSPVQPIVGDKSFKQLAEYISGGCTIISIILCGGLAIAHICMYRNRHEQRQVIRIVLLPAIICIFNFLSTCFYNASGYLRPIGEYYDCIALVSLYLLWLTYATPPSSRGSPRQLFDNLPTLHATYSYHPTAVKNSGLQHYYKSYVLVFQIIPVRLVTTIVEMAMYGSLCQQLGATDHKKSGHTIISVISTISTITCFLAVLHTMKLVKPALKGKSPIFKTVALKGLVGFSVLLQLVFSILLTTGALTATAHMDLRDWFVGLPQLITCAAGVVFSVLIVIPFWVAPYTGSAMPGVPRKGIGRAVVDVLNITDVLVQGLGRLPLAISLWKSGGGVGEAGKGNMRDGERRESRRGYEMQ